MLLAAVESANGVPEIVCTILLIATIIALIFGLSEAIGLTSFASRAGAGVGRFGTLVLAVILLVVYVVLC